MRWGTSVKQLKEQADMMPGDVLLVASFISYVGCFTKQYRVGPYTITLTQTLLNLARPPGEEMAPTTLSDEGQEDSNVIG